jgi:NADH:ubiquinone oxidoreductase subunit D
MTVDWTVRLARFGLSGGLSAMFADVSAILGSLDIVFGEINR